MSTAKRVRRINPSPSVAAAQRVRELKSQGLAIHDLTVGEPDFDTPEHVKAAAIRAIEAGETKYTPVNGTPALRTAITDRLRSRHGLAYTDAQITVGGGAKQVIFLALTATLDEGDEVVIPAPYWVSYPDMVRANDGTPVIVYCPEPDGFKLTPDRLRGALTDRTRWVVLNTPGNPTGSAYTTDELRALAAVLLDHPHVRVLTDEIYDEIWYDDGAAPSLAAVEPRLADRVFLTNGVSKTYAMAGASATARVPPIWWPRSTPSSRRSPRVRPRSARPRPPPRWQARRTSSGRPSTSTGRAATPPSNSSAGHRG